MPSPKFASASSTPAGLPDGIWEYLSTRHQRDAAGRREAIEGEVRYLASRGKDPVRIYAALHVAVRLAKAHEARVRLYASARDLSKWQHRVLRDVEKALTGAGEWCRLMRDGDPDAEEQLQALRDLREDLQFPYFDRSPQFPQSEDRPLRGWRRKSGGRPWIHQRPDELLRRQRVPEESRKALLRELGFFSNGR